VLETATLVLAPTTVITALLFYFGWAQTSALFGRLGIDQSALGFTVQDYMLRSVNSTFRPLSVVLLAAVAGLSAPAPADSMIVVIFGASASNERARRAA